MIRVQCPSCGARLRAPDEALGKKTKCPQCQSIVLVDPDRNAAFDDVLEPEVVGDGDDPYGLADGGDVGQPKSLMPATSEQRRPCPVCGEMIVSTASKCRYCGEVLDPNLKKLSRKRGGGSSDDEDLTAGEWVVAILCSAIGCIIGITWMLQGKPKGTKMFVISLISSAVGVVIELMRQAARGPGLGP